MSAPKIIMLMLLSIMFSNSLLLAEDHTESLKIVTHNVWYGFTKKPEPRHADWLKWMKAEAPDVVSLQELNGYTAEKLAADAAGWGHQYSVLLKEDSFPTGITSRFPITDVRRIREGMHHGLLRCRILGIWFYVIHFHPSNFARRIEEARHLKSDVESLPDADPRIILAGDFNGFSPADRAHYDTDSKLVPFFQMLDQRDAGARNLNQGRMDYGGIDAILSQGYIDLVDRARTKESAFVGTFPSPLVSDENNGTDRRLDYIFVSPNLLPKVICASILRDAQTERFSDHFPVTATVSLDDAGSAEDDIFLSKPEQLQEHGAGEGPAWHPELGLLTSGEGHINRRDKHGNTSVFRENAGSNGLMFDRRGRLVICEPVQRRVTRIEPDGSTKILAETYGGKKFNQPNDLTIDSRNRIYFSDPRYGERTGMELLDANGKTIEGVYRIDVDGAVTRIITHEVDRPNGLVVTHDDKYLLVADNNNSQGGARKLWRFDLRTDGTVDVSSQRLIHDWKTTRGPDGMKLDSEGRLYVAAGLNKPNPPHETADSPTAGVYVFSADGKLLQFVMIPRDETTNCAFGGDDLKTLFVTAGGSLWKKQSNTAGKPAWPMLPSEGNR